MNQIFKNSLVVVLFLGYGLGAQQSLAQDPWSKERLSVDSILEAFDPEERPSNALVDELHAFQSQSPDRAEFYSVMQRLISEAPFSELALQTATIAEVSLYTLGQDERLKTPVWTGDLSGDGVVDASHDLANARWSSHRVFLKKFLKRVPETKEVSRVLRLLGNEKIEVVSLDELKALINEMQAILTDGSMSKKSLESARSVLWCLFLNQRFQLAQSLISRSEVATERLVKAGVARGQLPVATFVSYDPVRVYEKREFPENEISSVLSQFEALHFSPDIEIKSAPQWWARSSENRGNSDVRAVQALSWKVASDQREAFHWMREQLSATRIRSFQEALRTGDDLVSFFFPKAPSLGNGRVAVSDVSFYEATLEFLPKQFQLGTIQSDAIKLEAAVVETLSLQLSPEVTPKDFWMNRINFPVMDQKSYAEFIEVWVHMLDPTGSWTLHQPVGHIQPQPRLNSDFLIMALEVARGLDEVGEALKRASAVSDSRFDSEALLANENGVFSQVSSKPEVRRYLAPFEATFYELRSSVETDYPAELVRKALRGDFDSEDPKLKKAITFLNAKREEYETSDSMSDEDIDQYEAYLDFWEEWESRQIEGYLEKEGLNDLDGKKDAFLKELQAVSEGLTSHAPEKVAKSKKFLEVTTQQRPNEVKGILDTSDDVAGLLRARRILKSLNLFGRLDINRDGRFDSKDVALADSIVGGRSFVSWR